jgi:sortase A
MSGAARRPDRSWRLLAGLATIAAGLGFLGNAGYIQAKALVAQQLIEQAWRDNQASGKPMQRPWSWADTVPVGRLEFVRQRRSLIVLDGDAGRTLAFGPGLRAGSALPAAPGNTVISAHRDTHFAVLRHVVVGDVVRVEGVDGSTVDYRVDRLDVIEEHDLSMTDQRGRDELTLVTCWPFDAVQPGGPLRYVVQAGRIAAPGATRRAADSVAVTPAVAPID